MANRKPFAFVTKDGKAVRKDVADRFASEGSQQIKDAMAGFNESKYALATPLYNPYALTQLLELNTYHYRACRTKARDVGGKGWYITHDEEAEEHDEPGEEEKSQIEKRIRDFSEPLTRTLEKAQFDYESVGWGAVELIREEPGDVNTDVIDILHIPAHTIRMHKQEDRWIQRRGARSAWFKNAGIEEQIHVKDGDLREQIEDPHSRGNEIVVWHNYSSRSDYYGLPDIVPALGAVIGDISRRDYNIAFFDNYGVPAYVVMISGDFYPGEPKDEEGNPDPKGQTDLEREIEEHFQTISKNPHSSLVLSVPSTEDGEGEVTIDIEPLSVETKEASFRLYRTDNRDEVLSAHGVDPYRVGIAETGSLGGSTAEQATEIYKESIVEPRQQAINDWFNKFVISSESLVFGLSEIDTSNSEQDLGQLERLFNLGAVTPYQIATQFADRFGLDPEEMVAEELHTFYINGEPVAVTKSFVPDPNAPELTQPEPEPEPEPELAEDAEPEVDDEEDEVIDPDDLDAALQGLRREMIGIVKKDRSFSGEFPFDSMTECIDRMSEEDISEPGAFCAAWYEETHGIHPSRRDK